MILIAQHVRSKKIFNELIAEKRDKISKLSEKVNYGNLTLYYKTKE